jgi:iron complex outermembrane receptor protein
VGLNFLYESLRATNIFPDTRNFRIEQRFDQKLWSLAPYLGGRYDFTEELSLESGVRYNVEHKDFTLASDSVGTISGISVAAIEEEQEKKTWTGVTGDVTLGYTPYWDLLDRIQNDNLNFYLKYARGMKAGHFNAGLTITGTSEGPNARIDPVEPEFIHAAELGWKSGWLDNRLVVNVAAFRYWYKDLQVFDITNEIGELPLQRLLNSDARVWGAEIELQARPLPGLSIQGGFGWLDGHFKDFVVRKAINAPRGQGSALTPFDYDGNPLIAAPKYSVSAIVDYEIPLGRFGSLIPGYDFSWRSKVYLDPQSLDPISQPPYWIHNARLAYRTPDARIEIAGWVENFTNTYYKEDVFDLTRDFDTILEVWGDPRTYGVTVTYTW